jgi:hypothetical protein
MSPPCETCGKYGCRTLHGWKRVRVESTDGTSVLRAITASAIDRFLVDSDVEKVQVHHPDGEVVTFSLEVTP